MNTEWWHPDVFCDIVTKTPLKTVVRLFTFLFFYNLHHSSNQEMSKWGDEELEDVGAQPSEELKTVVEYKTNEAGEKVKITRQVREYTTVRKVNKRVEERRKVHKRPSLRPPLCLKYF